MNTITVRDFMDNLDSTFDKVDTGQLVQVRRGDRIYAVVPVKGDDLTITAQWQEKIDEAKKSCRLGECI